LSVLGKIFCYNIFSCIPLGNSWGYLWGTSTTSWKPLY